MIRSRNFEFSWDLIGDIALGRPNLGNQTRVEVYRLMQFCFRDVLEKELGVEKADTVFYKAGELAGRHLYQNMIEPTTDLGEFVRQLQVLLRELKIGILRVEKSDLENGELILTVSEDLDCSGLPELDFEICIYDEGFIAALLEAFSGVPFHVQETDCWCTGHRTCRFVAKAVK